MDINPSAYMKNDKYLGMAMRVLRDVATNYCIIYIKLIKFDWTSKNIYFKGLLWKITKTSFNSWINLNSQFYILKIALPIFF